MNSARWMDSRNTRSSMVVALLIAPEIRLSTTRLEGNRLPAPLMPRDDLSRLMMPSASPRSMMVKPLPRPRWWPYWRKRMLAVAWKVPPITRRQLWPVSWPARQSISWAARRVKVSSRMDSGGTSCSSRWAMRKTRVRVLPLPAPAMTKSGPEPWVTAAYWAGLSTSVLIAAGVGGAGCSSPGKSRGCIGGLLPQRRPWCNAVDRACRVRVKSPAVSLFP